MSVGNLHAHMRTHSDVRSWQCVYCPRSFRRRDHLNRHYRMHDPTSQRLKCKLCGVCFASHTQRREHRLHKHKDMTVIHCKKCLKTFSAHAKLKRHVCGHDDDADSTNNALVHNAPSHRKRKRQSCESDSGADDSDEDFLDDSSSISEDDALSSNDVDSQSDFGGDVRNRRITARDLARIDRKMAYGEA